MIDPGAMILHDADAISIPEGHGFPEPDPAVAEPPDDMGISPIGTPGARRPPRRSTVRLGPIAMPAGVAAWGLSIALHGGLVVAACLLIRSHGLDFGGQGEGDSRGGSDVSLVSGLSPGPSIQSGLPENAVAPDPVSPPLHKIESEDAAPREPTWDDHATRSQLAPAESESEDTLTIGVNGGSFMSAPVFQHGGGGSSRGGATGGAGALTTAQGRSAAASQSPGSGGGAGGGAGDTSCPGLPGELMGSGFPKPAYPLEARRLGEEGTVVIELLIRADGSLGYIRVVDDSGHALLRDAALAAARKLRGHRFTPGRRDGRAVDWVARIRYPFILR